MRILFASPYKNVTGGISRWAQNIVHYYQSNHSEIDIDILSFDDTKEHDAEYYISKSRLQRVFRGIRLYGRAIKEMHNKTRKNKYDIIHISSSATWGLVRDVIMIHIAHLKGIKCVIHFHFGRIPDLSKQRNWEWKLLKYVVGIADRTIVMDMSSYNTLIANNCNHIEYVPNPLSPNISNIINGQKDIKRKHNVLVFAGQCVQAKGIYELVEACRTIPNIELQMYGAITKSVEDELRMKWDSPNSILQIMGNRPYNEVIAAMNQCGVFVLPTYTEGFPNVILESMACGCAIITTPVGAIPEMLAMEDSKHLGILVQPQNSDELRTAIIKMLSDESFANECRSNVQHRVYKRYNIESVCSKITRIWESLM